MRIIEKEFNVITGKETITERDETVQELADRQARETKLAQAQAETQAKAMAKAALLEKLGITEDEAKLLLG